MQGWLYRASLLGLLALVDCGADKRVARVGRDYYVNNRSTACRDDGPGSEAEPFCTFRSLNSISSGDGFGLGDRILLARGADFHERLVVKAAGKGSPDQVSVIGAYGNGPRPRIILNGHWSEKCLLVIDPDHWEIRDLELGHAGAGLVVHYTTVGNRNLLIENILVHHHSGVLWNWNAENLIDNSAGIVFTALVESHGDASPHVLKGLTLRSIEGTHNTLSVMLSPARLIGVSTEFVYNHYNWEDVKMQDLDLHDDDAGVAAGEIVDCQPFGAPSEGPFAGRSVKGCCPGSVLIGSALRTTIVNSSIRRAGACFTGSGTAAVSTGLVKDFTVVNSIISETPDTASGDQTAIDFEYRVREARVRNTLLSANTGSAIELYSAYGDYNIDSEISGNVFVHNGVDPIWLLPEPVGALFRLNLTDSPATGRIENNLFAEPSGILSSGERINPSGQFPPAWPGYRFGNNFTVPAERTVDHAAADYGAAQGPRWFYRYAVQDGWREMSFEPESNSWRAPDGSGRIQQFVQRPGRRDVARVWRAPATGAVTIRGRAIQTDPQCETSIQLRVVKSPGGGVAAIKLWPADSAWQVLNADDSVGVENNLDHVEVAANDELRFEVAGSFWNLWNNRCEISWVPAIVETRNYAHRWTFETPGRPGTTKGFEGWTPLNSVRASVSGGLLRLEVTGAMPAVRAPEKLAFSGDRYGQVEFRTANGTAAAIPARLQFVTTADGTWNEEKSMRFTIPPGNANVLLDLRSSAAWRESTIDSLGISFEAGVGTEIGIDTAGIRQSDNPGL